MQRVARLFLVVVIALANVLDAQIDQNLCPDGPITFIDPSWPVVPPKFEITAELVEKNDVAAISQAFLSQRDSIVFTIRGYEALLYWNFATNEQFQVVPVVIAGNARFQCFSESINSSASQTSTIQPGTLVLKPSVLLGYDARNQRNPDWGLSQIDDSSVRGIPTNVFRSCFYLQDIQASVSATYQISDVTRAQVYLATNQSTILEINVEVVTQSGQRESYTYNVFRYTPNPNQRELQQAVETPAGVYCLNRISTLAVPSNIPERFSINSEAFVSTVDNSIFSANEIFDKAVQFTRSELWAADSSGLSMTHFTEIHDFGTGLRYRYNHQNRHCQVDDIVPVGGDVSTVDGRPNLVQMADGSHLLLLDDTTYQYTGEKRCRDHVWCHVWLSEKPIVNSTLVEHREWYWAFQIHDEPLQQWVPVKIVFKLYNSSGSLVISSESNFFDFRRNPATIYEIDYTMADCYRAMGPEENFTLGVISFTINNDREYPVQRNVDYLRFMIWQTLARVLGVRSVRISNVIVNHDGKDLPVTFTLLDVPPRLGPVAVPLQELSLTAAITKLRTEIDSNMLTFRTKFNTTEVTLTARNNSLQIIYTSTDQSANQCPNQTSTTTPSTGTQSTTTPSTTECPSTSNAPRTTVKQIIQITYKSSGPMITGFWIGFVILGLLVGTVGGFFVSKRFIP